MNRNDICDSYVLGCSSGLLRRWRLHPPKRTITPPFAGKHSAQPSRVSPVRLRERYAGTPTIGNARSLSFPFHSPSAIEAGWCGVERRPPVQGRSELQAHDATVLQSLAVEVREGLGRSPGLCHTSSASFLGTPQDLGQLPCVTSGRCFRPSVSLLSGDSLDHELPSVE